MPFAYVVEATDRLTALTASSKAGMFNANTVVKKYGLAI
jgi:hypothetical protein